MNKLKTRNLLAGLALGAACMLLLAAKSGRETMHGTCCMGRHGLTTHKWPQMAEARIDGLYRPVGLFRIDRETGQVWALVTEAEGYEVKGWFPLDQALEPSRKSDGL